MRAAVVTSELSNERVYVRTRRLASLTDRHLFALRYEVVALDHVSITLASELRHARAGRRSPTIRGAAARST